MPETLYVLTRSAAVVNRFRRSSPPDRKIKTVACLAEVGLDVTEARIIIDPRALDSCCVAALKVSSQTGIPGNVRFLDLPLPSRSVHEVARSVPPCVEFDRRGAAVSPALGEAPTSAAWRRRERLFAQTPARSRQACFLDLARRHMHEPYREADAAADLRLGVRHLTRLTIRWFGYSPRVVIGLFRVESMSRALRLTMRGLKDLARAYGYSSRQAMNRHFQSFTGVHPAAYRRLQQRPETELVNPSMSEYGPSPEASEGGIYAAEGTPIGSRPIGVGNDRPATAATIQAASQRPAETLLD